MDGLSPDILANLLNILGSRLEKMSLSRSNELREGASEEDLKESYHQLSNQYDELITNYSEVYDAYLTLLEATKVLVEQSEFPLPSIPVERPPRPTRIYHGSTAGLQFPGAFSVFVNRIPRSGDTILNCICQGYYEVVKLLLDHGADTENKDLFMILLWFMPSREGHFEIVELLLDRGADFGTLY